MAPLAAAARSARLTARTGGADSEAMRHAGLAALFSVVLVTGCASDQMQQAVGVDAQGSTDGGRDVPNVEQDSAADAPAAQDATVDGPGPAADVVEPFVPTLPVTCQADDDCCVALDGCLATLYLVGKAEQNALQHWLSVKPQSGCLNCIAPAVQVRCAGGFCEGEELPFSANLPVSLMQGHCGVVPIADAAAAASHVRQPSGPAPADAGSRMSWGCGTGAPDPPE